MANISKNKSKFFLNEVVKNLIKLDYLILEKILNEIIITNNNNFLTAIEIDEPSQYVGFLNLNKKNNKFSLMSNSFMYGETVYHGFCNK